MKIRFDFFKKIKRKTIVYGAVTAAIVVTAVTMNMGNAVDVDIQEVKKGLLQGRIELRGKVQLDIKEKVFSKLAGNVKDIIVKEGDTVDSGAVLAKLDVEDINLAIQKAQEGYNAAKATLENYKTSVKPEEISEAEAQARQMSIAVEAALRDYNYKKDKLEKIRALKMEGGASEQELKDAELAFASADSTLKDARQKLDIARNNISKIKKTVTEYGIDAAKASADQAKLQVEELKTNLGRTSIYSGMKGIILARHVDQGEYVQPGTLLYEIGDSSSAYVRADILSDDAKKVKVGQKAIITGEVLDDKEYYGEVYYVAPRAETSVSSLGVEQQRVEVRIRYDNTKIELKAGYGVDVKIITEEKENSLYVPDKAVFDMNDKDGVFTVKDGKLVLNTVKTGIENDDSIEILEGLNESDRIVVDPDNKLKPGIRVK